MFVPETEIFRLCELMPASGRMYIKIQNKPEQRQVLEMSLPLPWQRQKVISINFDLWQRLDKGQRDLILLRSVSWLLGVKWFKPDIYQGATAVGLVASLGEFFEGDLVGLVAAGGLTVVAALQVWRINRSPQRELEADEAGIRIATRRGYTEMEAAKNLYTGIERLAQLEGRGQLDFAQLMRCQNLKTIAGLSRIGIPDR
ncbi:MAG: DUF3318 domain-containing protein [Prochlorotrichaceae cyanobacterium]|jgi:hypothetical protein